MSHITGGGFTENIPRVLPEHLSVKLDAKNWPLLPVFKWLKSTGGIENHELARTFNCGIGMVLVASKESASIIIENLKSEGEAIFTLGQVVPTIRGSERVQIENLECWS
jgi:phosphoribosylamine--glycine ligase/phosphoribosylformylglycinamidine cyclo-ligase